MTPRTRVAAALATLLTAATLALIPTAAQAHSLESSTVAVRVGDDSVEATVSVALATLDEAIGTPYSSTSALGDDDLEAIADYVSAHLELTGVDGAAWSESVTDVTRADVEGIDSVSVDITVDPADADPGSFTLRYDGVIEADATHEAVVVLTDAAGEISTAGVLTAADDTLAIGTATEAPGWLDMVGLGFHHVLEGADHLLFLLALLLVAPLAVSRTRRWEPRPGIRGPLRGALGVVTAFTVGHTVTLIATAAGWIAPPTAIVEILVAASVAVAAVHAIRPIIARGEVVIAGAFGLVHGMAFAGILSDLGLDTGLSVLNLLAFNVGVEAAQLVAVAALLPSLVVLGRTRWGVVVRVGAASVAIVAAALWAAERVGLAGNPLQGVEDAVVASSWAVAVGMAVVAGIAFMEERRVRARESVAAGSEVASAAVARAADQVQ